MAVVLLILGVTWAQAHTRDAYVAQELWNVGADTDEQVFGNVVDVATCGDSTYVVDSGQRAVFVLDDRGRFHGQLGSSGEGPGEHGDVYAICVWDSTIGIGDYPSRLHLYDLTRQYLHSITIPSVHGGPGQPPVRVEAVDDGVVVEVGQSSLMSTEPYAANMLFWYSFSGDSSHVLSQVDLSPSSPEVIDERFFTGALVWDAAGDEVVVSREHDDCTLRHYDLGQSLAADAECDLPLVRRSGDEKDRVRTYQIKTGAYTRRAEPRDHHRRIGEVLLRSGGMIWVRSGAPLADDVQELRFRAVASGADRTRSVVVRFEGAPVALGRDRVFVRGERIYVFHRSDDGVRPPLTLSCFALERREQE